MSSPSRLPFSPAPPLSHTAAASTRGPRTSGPFRSPATQQQQHRAPATPHSSQQPQQAQQQHLSDKVRVAAYLTDRWLAEDGGVEALLADKQLTADSVAELRQQAVDGQWLDDWPQSGVGMAARYSDTAPTRPNHTAAP